MNSSTKTLRIHRFNNGWIFLSGFLLLQLVTTNNSFFVSAALRGSAIADDWDTMCVAQANALGHCVGASGGDPELCKNCIKMAANMNRWEIALAGCVDTSEFCNGCESNIEAYFDCGIKNSLVESTIETAIASRPPEETESVSQQRPGNPVGNVRGTTNLEASSNSFTLPSGSGGAQGETPPSDRNAGNSEGAATVGVGGNADDWDRASSGPDYYGRKAGKSGKYNYSYFYYYPKAGKSGKSGKYNNSYFYYYPKAGKSGKYRNYDYSDDYYYQSGSKSGKSGKYYYSDDYYYQSGSKSGKSGKYYDFDDYYSPKAGKSGRAGKSANDYYSEDYYPHEYYYPKASKSGKYYDFDDYYYPKASKYSDDYY